mgnify:CR=1 FL=1
MSSTLAQIQNTTAEALDDPCGLYRQADTDADETISINTWHRFAAGHLTLVSENDATVFDGRSDITVPTGEEGIWKIFTYVRCVLNNQIRAFKCRLRNQTDVLVVMEQRHDFDTNVGGQETFSFKFAVFLEAGKTYRITHRYETQSGAPATITVGGNLTGNTRRYTRIHWKKDMNC